MNPTAAKFLGTFLIVLALVAAAIGLAQTRRVQLLHRATAVVQLERDETDLPGFKTGMPAGADMDYILKTEAELIPSEFILNPVIEKLDLNSIDAGITVGLYEYAVGSLPLPVKVLAGITGFRGSKKKGLAMIERVSQEGNWSRDDAKTLLIVLYTREKRYPEALGHARDLMAKYPRNYLFRLEAADALVSQAEVERKNKNIEAAVKAEREAFATFDSLLHDTTVRDTVSRALDLVHFKYGEVLLTAGEGERAAKEFLAATRVEHAEPTLAISTLKGFCKPFFASSCAS